MLPPAVRFLARGTAVALACLTAAAAAHEYWIERDAGAYVLYQGHLYASHAGEARVPYDPGIVRQTHCLRPNGERVQPQPPAAYPLRLPGACAALFVQTASGYWSQTLTGTVNKPKTEAAGVLRSWRSEESIKYIETYSPALAVPLTGGFELVPLNDPFQVALGDKLSVRATWQGKPKAGVAVAYHGDTRGVTGADGTVNIRLRAPGTQVLAASFEEPLKDTGADKIVRATILQFEKR